MFQSGMWTLRIVAATALLALMADSVSAGLLRDRRESRRASRGYNGGAVVVGNGGYYGSPYGGYGYPGYYPGNNVVLGATNNYQSNYYTPTNNMTATIDLRVPPNAQVFFDDEPTKQRGEMRIYTSPPLTGDSVYHYKVRVKWDDNGKTKEETRRVEARAGRRTVVDFTRADTTNPKPDEK